MILHVVSETAHTVTVGWSPIAGSRGYVFYVDGRRVSNTWDPSVAQVRFGKPDAGEHDYEVVALTALDDGSLRWPAVVPPPGFVLRGIWDAPSANSAPYGADWTQHFAPLGFTSMFSPPDAADLGPVAASGGKSWVQILSGQSDADAVKYAKAAWATGAVWGFYVWDEPDASQRAQVAARSKLLHDAIPGCVTITSHWDPATLAVLAGAVDVLAIDYYPVRGTAPINLAGVKACVAECEAKGSRYSIVVQAFTDGTPNYRLPTAAELQAQLDYARSTRSEGYYVYAWGATGAPASGQLQNHPELLAVLKAENAA